MAASISCCAAAFWAEAPKGRNNKALAAARDRRERKARMIIIGASVSVKGAPLSLHVTFNFLKANA
ncbi:hypothetical protein MyNCGM683_41670 [Achromobacter xylosoxidans]